MTTHGIALVAIAIAIALNAWHVAMLVRGRRARRCAMRASIWRVLREAADAELAERKADHDRTGEHVWLETSTHDHPKRAICAYCSAKRDL